MGISKSIEFGKHKLTLETGRVARQADGAVLADMDGTIVLATVVGKNDPIADATKDFFPLRVDYQEKTYSFGKIPGGFFKREGRPSERETLTARLIDRPIRPLFPEKFTSEVQVITTVLSVNPNVSPDIVAIIATSAAIAISGIPFNGPLAAARVGYRDGEYLLNPSEEELKSSQLDLVVAGTKTSVLMVESEANMLSEDVMLSAVMYGHKEFQKVISLIEDFASASAKPKWDWVPAEGNKQLFADVSSNYREQIESAYAITDKLARKEKLGLIKEDLSAKFNSDADESIKSHLATIVKDIESDIVRSNILNNKPRIDGRDTKTVRPITVETNVLPRTHGSALFTRGETQALVVVTLGTGKDAQIIETSAGKDIKDSFMLHYNFPPYSVNEIGNFGSPKRREIGHGRLAKRSVVATMPSNTDFPYVVRAVSEITESNGSSSMATVCGTSLALMDAGVPVKAPVAGIAMGLIKDQDKFAVITDILGDEDHLGDMDFKVAGTDTGITALQMDIKIDGITEEIMQQALSQAKDARLHILNIMNQSISTAKTAVSDFAPQLSTFKVDPDKIGAIIGKGGSTIKGLIEETGAEIDISEDGTVQVAASSKESLDLALSKIEQLTIDVEVGGIYDGKVVKIVDFGAFVSILPGKEGLLHISQISEHRVAKVSDELSEGQVVKVKVLDIDRQGKIKLTAKSIEA